VKRRPTIRKDSTRESERIVPDSKQCWKLSTSDTSRLKIAKYLALNVATLVLFSESVPYKTFLSFFSLSFSLSLFLSFLLFLFLFLFFCFVSAVPSFLFVVRGPIGRIEESHERRGRLTIAVESRASLSLPSRFER